VEVCQSGHQLPPLLKSCPTQTGYTNYIYIYINPQQHLNACVKFEDIHSYLNDYNQNVKLFSAVHSFIKRSKRFDNNIVI
jgi:hypothetical protein